MPLPSGNITFLFTDIEGSTRLWEEHPEAMRVALARHDALLRQAIENNQGCIFKTVGDAFCAAFACAQDALKAALRAHLLLLKEEWPETGPLRVRMGVHTGVAEERDGDYFGPTLNRVARLQGVGHGQQTLLSLTAYQSVSQSLPPDIRLQDRGLHRLKDLLAPEHIWQLLHPALPSEFPPLKSLDYLPTNLPRQMTSFIGRAQEMEQVKRLLPSSPLLTLLGTGGTGKTRLAVQVGAEMLDDYKDGVWLVELAALADPELVPQAVATALGLREEVNRPLLQSLQDHLRDRRLLLLLDNCEHVVDACAALADTLLTASPHLSILATSREPLRIAGERSWRVPSLMTPDPRDLPMEEKDVAAALMEYDACRLFVERAVVVRQDFALTRRNMPVVADLCRQLDGIPLAIELAAARVRSLTVEEIHSKLDNRFRLLTGGSRTALPRQQTLRALVDWSYDMLNDQEKTLLGRLSVFAGGWMLPAAERVGAGQSATGEGIEDWEVLDLLTNLAEKSLVVAQAYGESTRYRLLETVRQYAQDRLRESGETSAVCARHADYFLTLAEEIYPKLTGPEQAQWLGVLEEEHANLRQALTLYSTEEPEEASQKGLRLCAALQRFWWTRVNLSEGWERLCVLLARPGAQKPTGARAATLLGAGVLAYRRGDHARARALLEESVAIQRALGNREGIARALGNLGIVAYEVGDYGGARARHEEAVAIFRELGHQGGLAAALSNLGNVAQVQGDYKAAVELQEESLAIRRELGDRGGIAICLSNLGNMALEQGDNVRARVLVEESLAIRRELGDRGGIASSLLNLGLAAKNEGGFAQARILLEESLAIGRELEDKGGIALALLNLGNLALKQDDYARARVLHQESLERWRELGEKKAIAYELEAFAMLAMVEAQEERCVLLWGASAILREIIGSPLPPKERKSQKSQQTEMRERWSEDAFAAAWEQGRAMTLEQVIHYALEERAS